MRMLISRVGGTVSDLGSARLEAGVRLPHVHEHNPDDGASDEGDSQHGEQDSYLPSSFKGVAGHAALGVAQARFL